MFISKKEYSLLLSDISRLQSDMRALESRIAFHKQHADYYRDCLGAVMDYFNLVPRQESARIVVTEKLS